MKFEKMMLYVGSEQRPSFKDPSKMVQQVAFMQGLDTFKPFVSEEQFVELSQCSIMSPFLVTVDVNLTNGNVRLAGYVDYDTVVGNLPGGTDAFNKLASDAKATAKADVKDAVKSGAA